MNKEGERNGRGKEGRKEGIKNEGRKVIRKEGINE